MNNHSFHDMVSISLDDVAMVHGGMINIQTHTGGPPPMEYGSTIVIQGWTTPIPVGEGFLGVKIHFG